MAVLVKSVPVAGRVTLVGAVVVKVKEYAPIVLKSSAKLAVLAAAKVRVPVRVVSVLPLKVGA